MACGCGSGVVWVVIVVWVVTMVVVVWVVIVVIVVWAVFFIVMCVAVMPWLVLMGTVVIVVDSGGGNDRDCDYDGASGVLE